MSFKNINQPKSNSPGEDLFILEYFTNYQNVTHQEAQSIWNKQSPKMKNKYEKEANKNLLNFKRKRNENNKSNKKPKDNKKK